MPSAFASTTLAGDVQQERSTTMLLPTLDQAAEIAWDPALSKLRGVYGFDSIDPRSRSFNMIRAKLMELRRDRKWRMIGVVSATPNVGKSFISANLAAALSRDPRLQTYLLDLDLRRASLTALFGIAPQDSLLDYLSGTGRNGAPGAYRLQGQTLLVLPTVRGLVHSAELLAGAPAQNLFRAMRGSDERNYFIVDLPPVFANDDAVTTMTRLDAYVLVAEEGKTTQREISDAAALLGEERLAGVILNKYRGGLMSEGYGVDAYYAKGYYGETEESERS
mgnify:CR=1 FL=1